MATAILLVALLLSVSPISAVTSVASPLSLVAIIPKHANPTDSQSIELNQRAAITAVFSRPVISLGSDFIDQPITIDTNITHSDAYTTDAATASVQSPFIFTLNSGGRIRGKVRWATTYIARFDPDDDWPTDLDFTVSFHPRFTTFDGATFASTDQPQAHYTTPELRSGHVSRVRCTTCDELTDNHWDAFLGDEFQSNPEVPPGASMDIQFDGSADLDLVRAALVLSSTSQGESFAVERCTMTDWWSNTKGCFTVTPSSLQAHTSYTLEFPADTAYSADSGRTKAAISFAFQSLAPFKFSFLKKHSWENTPRKIKHQNLDLVLRHGLKNDAQIEALKSAISLTSSSGSLDFTLTRNNKWSVRMHVTLEPETEYTVTATSAANVLDGFDQALQASSGTFLTEPLPSFFIQPTLANYYSTGVNTYEASERPTVWQAMTRPVFSPTSFFSIGALADAEETLNYIADPKARTPEGFTTITQEASGSSYEVKSAELPSSDLFVTASGTTSRNYHQYNVHSVTDFLVTAMSFGDDLSVWVTRMSDSSVVSGATVTVYTVPSYQGSTTQQHTGETDADGLASFDSAFSSFSSNRRAVHIQKGSEQAFIMNGRGSSFGPDEITSTIITDRAIYKPGDTVSVKMYARKLEGSQWSLAGLGTSTLSIQWTGGQNPKESRETVHWSANHGSAHTVLTIPEDVSFGNKALQLTTGSSSSSVSLLIADPRRPTGVVTIDSAEKIFRPRQSLPLTVTAETDTGIPISGAEVAIRWTLRRRGDSGLHEIDGLTSLTTGADGSGLLDFTFPADRPTISVADGDDVSFTATWIGPTGELLEASMSRQVRESLVVVGLSTSVVDPLPGFPFNFIPTWEYLGDEPIGGSSTTVAVAPWVEGITNQEIVSGNLLSCSNPGPFPCPWTIPEASKYVAVAFSGAVYSPQVVVGRASEDWTAHPLTQISTLSMALSDPQDTAGFVDGETATISFYNPFQCARVLLLWGSTIASATVIRNVPITGAGQKSVDFTIESGTDEACAGGCRITAAVSVARSSGACAGTVLPVDVPVSPLLDINAPNTFTQSLRVPVKDPTPPLDVQISMQAGDSVICTDPSADAGTDGCAESVSPGTETTISVDIRDRNGAAIAGEVALFAVDRAFLELQPHGLVDLDSAFSVDLTPSSPEITTSASRLASKTAWDEDIAAAARRIAADPWVTPRFPLTAQGGHDWGVPDDDYLDSLSSMLTDSPQSHGIYYDGGIQFGLGAPGGAGAAVPEGIEMDDAVYASAPETTARNPSLSSPPAPAAPPPTMAIRSNFQTTPLFIGQQIIDPDQEATKQITFTLPDNIATFSIRAYAVGSNGQSFGSAEAEIVARKQLNMNPLQPRFTRIGDKYDAGVSITLAPLFTGDITVTLQDGTESLVGNASSSIVQAVQNTRGPFNIRFPYESASQGKLELTYAATTSGTSPMVDGMQISLDVNSPTDPIFVATSMALQASTTAPQDWEEGISFPEFVSGTSPSLDLVASVGRRSSMETLARSLIASADQAVSHDTGCNAHLWASIVAVEPLFRNLESVVASDLMGYLERARSELMGLSDSYGLRYCKRIYGGRRYYNVRLSAFALYMDLASGETGSVFDASLTSHWRTGVVQGLVEAVQQAKAYQYDFSDWDSLAWAYLALGMDWASDVPNDVKFELQYARLADNYASLSPETKAVYAVSSLYHGDTTADVDTVVNEFFSSMRIQARTAYVTHLGSQNALPMKTQSLVITALSKFRLSNALVEKTANYVAQGSERGYWSARGTEAIRIFALRDYDLEHDSLNPDLKFFVDSSSTTLVEEQFTTAARAPYEDSWPWSAFTPSGGPPSLRFGAVGSGEVSVAVGLTFVPVPLPFPVYRGISVNRIYRKVDPLTSKPIGDALQVITIGEVVEVRIQVTTPDDLESVAVEDYVPAGLEPIDPLVGTEPSPQTSFLPRFDGFGGIRMSEPFFEPMVWYWEPRLGNRQTMVDRVTWSARRLPGGTYEVSYRALAVTPGFFGAPAARATVRDQPEVMGMSDSITFVVTSEPVAVDDVSDYLLEKQVPAIPAIVDKFVMCDDGCTGVCNSRTGSCVAVDKMLMQDNPEETDYHDEHGCVVSIGQVYCEHTQSCVLDVDECKRHTDPLEDSALTIGFSCSLLLLLPLSLRLAS